MSNGRHVLIAGLEKLLQWLSKEGATIRKTWYPPYGRANSKSCKLSLRSTAHAPASKGRQMIFGDTFRFLSISQAYQFVPDRRRPQEMDGHWSALHGIDADFAVRCAFQDSPKACMEWMTGCGFGEGIERWDIARWESRLCEKLGGGEFRPYARRMSTPVGGRAPDENTTDGIAPTRSMVLRLVDVEGEALAGEDYEVELADGSVRSGQLDGDGLATLLDVAPGQAKVSWPNLHIDDWAT